MFFGHRLTKFGVCAALPPEYVVSLENTWNLKFGSSPFGNLTSRTVMRVVVEALEPFDGLGAGSGRPDTMSASR